MPEHGTSDQTPSREGTFVQLAIIIESLPAAIVIVDHQGTIAQINREFERLFQYRQEEILGQNIELLVPQRSRGNHAHLRAQFMDHPESRGLGKGRELYAVRKDATEFPAEIGLKPVETDDGKFILGAIIDITERKRMEEMLRTMNEELERRVEERTAELSRSNEALVRSNLELQQFAYIASHDLQAPLRNISGFVQLLQEDYRGKLDASADDWIQRTVENTKYMQTLIRDLLSYSKVDARARPFAPVDCAELVDQATKLLESSIRDASAIVTRGDLPIVMGDRSQLAQLFLNLIANGITYHGAEAPRIHVSAEKIGEGWIFAIRDNGIGVEVKHQERIFEIFRRLHTRQTYPGTGIGLAICRRVASRHGGKVWVQSVPGKGSTFYFSLPRNTGEQHEPRTDSGQDG